MPLQHKVEVEETIEFGAELILSQTKGMGNNRVRRREPTAADAVALEPFPALPDTVVVDGGAHRLRKTAVKFDKHAANHDVDLVVLRRKGRVVAVFAGIAG